MAEVDIYEVDEAVEVLERELVDGGEFHLNPDEWTPHPDWPDIKYILQNDTYGYAGSFIELITDDYDTISLSGGVAYRTSDGAYYTSATVTHTWDKSKDVPCARGYKTRWVITYLSSEDWTSTTYKQPNILWCVLNCNITTGYIGTASCHLLESAEFVKDKRVNKTFLPQVFTNDYNLLACPDLSYIACTDITQLFNNCFCIKKIKSINIINCTTMNHVFQNCYSLATIEGILDCEHITSISYAFYQCYCLRNVQIKNLKVSLSLSTCTLLTHASLLYLLQNLQTVTAGSQTLTLDATNLAKLTDTEKALATDKGWLLA